MKDELLVDPATGTPVLLALWEMNSGGGNYLRARFAPQILVTDLVTSAPIFVFKTK